MKILSFLLLICSLSTAVSQPRSVQPIDSLIQQKMQEAKLVGVGTAIIINNKVVWEKGFGYADRERQIPFTP
ncbi:CubicO group peptidase (beta-lactamase class C family) [Siphonobacter sp. BAB-5404]|nr:CubicO group peptidase (beta-lactamase class C family) [Siphonobacter sp. SORGH_AS_0500]